MTFDYRAYISAVQRLPEVETILAELCALTGMGFAAVARVTADRWVACQVLDRVEFGLEAGAELEIKTTICDEIRASGEGVYIDHASGEPSWRTHHTPALYGFESYISWPIVRGDGSFFGTLCALDSAPSAVPLASVVPQVAALARRVAEALDAFNSAVSR